MSKEKLTNLKTTKAKVGNIWFLPKDDGFFERIELMKIVDSTVTLRKKNH